MENENLVLIAQFCLHHEVEPSFMLSLHEFGLIKILELDKEQYLLGDELTKVERMIRLHDDLGINFEGIDVVNVLLEQIEILQQELLSAKNRLGTFAP
jgi:hypothetical protein